jgi:hypothetical protein
MVSVTVPASRSTDATVVEPVNRVCAESEPSFAEATTVMPSSKFITSLGVESVTVFELMDARCPRAPPPLPHW